MPVIDFTQHIRSIPKRIWQALTDEQELKTWLKAADVSMTTEVNRRFYWKWNFGALRSHGYGGTIATAKEPDVLELNWEMPECETVSKVQITLKGAFYGLENDYGGTDLRLVHTGIPEYGRGLFELDGHNRHWRQSIGELAAYIEQRPGKPRPGAIAGLLFVGGASGQGLLVRDAILESPAYEAGIRAGDRILSVEGRPMAALDNFHDWIDYCRAGDVGEFVLQDRTTYVKLKGPEDIQPLVKKLQR